MKKIVIWAIGKDRPGIVAGITGDLFEAGCNLEDSAMTLLEGEFAILLMCSHPRRMSWRALQERLHRNAKRMGLLLHLKEMEISPATRPGPERTVMVSASGADQTGILHRLSSVLATRKVNITDLTSRQIPGPDKTTLYLVMIEASLPNQISMEDLRRELASVAAQMGLDLSVRRLDVEQL